MESDGRERAERRLAAIFAADVAGYSRLMGADEEGTLAALKAILHELGYPKVTEHRGRIVKTTGDGVLVEFPSVVAAVRCAVEVQRAMAERNTDVPTGRRIEFRIGINLGDRPRSGAGPAPRLRLRRHGRADAQEHRPAGSGVPNKFRTAGVSPACWCR
jgi:class 3 adenylate cyclase